MSILKSNLCSSKLEYKALIQFIPEIFMVRSLLSIIALGKYFHLDPING